MSQVNASAIRILMIEDNPGDVRLAQEAWKITGEPCEIVNVDNGDEAMERLLRLGAHAEAERPHIILLDLSLPRKSGLETLQEIKNNPKLRTIPVVVLTSSRSPDDVQKAYKFGANCYITKPPDLEKLSQVIEVIRSFWFSTATLPQMNLEP